MRGYMEFISTSSTKEVNQFIKKGWEVIEKAKTGDDGPYVAENVIYHLGYPYKKRIEELSSIIEAYEKYGLKEELYNKVAAENGDNIDELVEDASYYYPHEVKNTIKTASFMEWYEKTLNNIDVRYKYKRDEETIKF